MSPPQRTAIETADPGAWWPSPADADREQLVRAFDAKAVAQVLVERRIDAGELSFGDVLGHGKFGEVRAATWRGDAVAVKKLYPRGMDAKGIDAVKRAAEIQLRLSTHAHVLQLLVRRPPTERGPHFAIAPSHRTFSTPPPFLCVD